MVQQLAAGHGVEVLQLSDRYFWLYHHNTENKGSVLYLKKIDREFLIQKMKVPANSAVSSIPHGKVFDEGMTDMKMG